MAATWWGDAPHDRPQCGVYRGPRVAWQGGAGRTGGGALPAGPVHHIGTFPQLEDQMTNFTSDIDRAAAGYSPDRVDALVWAFTQLLVERMKGEGIYEWYHQQAEAAAQRSKPQPVQSVPQPGSMEWFQWLHAQQEKG